MFCKENDKKMHVSHGSREVNKSRIKLRCFVVQILLLVRSTCDGSSRGMGSRK